MCNTPASDPATVHLRRQGPHLIKRAHLIMIQIFHQLLLRWKWVCICPAPPNGTSEMGTSCLCTTLAGASWSCPFSQISESQSWTNGKIEPEEEQFSETKGIFEVVFKKKKKTPSWTHRTLPTLKNQLFFSGNEEIVAPFVFLDLIFE